MEKIIFQEEQKSNLVWLTIVLIISLFSVVAPFAYGVYSQEVLHKPFGDNPVSTGTLIAIGLIAVIIIAVVNWIIIKMRLKIKITSEALWVSYPPLARWKKITPEMIQRYEIRTYNAIREFGGHGLKKTRKYGASYTISGNVGLQLYFVGGKKFLIGTQKKQALEYAMHKLMTGEKQDGL
jgi:hypothetical protein